MLCVAEYLKDKRGQSVCGVPIRPIYDHNYRKGVTFALYKRKNSRGWCKIVAQYPYGRNYVKEVEFESLAGRWVVEGMPAKPPRVRVGILARGGSAWVGVHWSAHNRRLCINPIPCVTLWVTLKGGKTPC